MNVAVFGSRQGVTLERVGRYLSERGAGAAKGVVLVSGGADGVDHYSEQTWYALGGRVLSFRPKQLGPEEYGVEEWSFGGDTPPYVRLLIEHPTFETWAGAALYRDMLIAETAARGVAFRAGKSRGTSHTIGFFKAEQKPCAVYDEEEQDE